MANKKSRIAPPAPASLDVGLVVHGLVSEVLRLKAEEIAEGGRFADRSYLDDGGRHHMRGGIWNTDAAHAADGFGKGDVNDVVRTLRSRGVHVAFEDVDAFLSQLVRTGSLLDAELVVLVGDRATTIRLDVEPTTPPPVTPMELRIRGMSLVEQRPGVFVVRSVAGGGLANTHVVMDADGTPICTCVVDDCGHVRAVKAHRTAGDDSERSGRFAFTSNEDGVVFRSLLPLFVGRGLYATPKRRERGNQPRNTAQCAMQLILRSLLGRSFASHADTATLRRLRVIDRPAGTTSLDRYRSDEHVVALLREVRDVATRTIRARGIEVASSHLIYRGDRLADEIVHALRLDTRLSTLTPRAELREIA